MRRVLVYSCLLILATVMVGCGKPPEPKVVVEGKAVSTARGSYCWGTTCADTIATPSEIAIRNGIKPTPVPEGASVIVSFGTVPSEMGVQEWKNNDRIKVTLDPDNTFALPKEAGIYTYFGHARWEKRGSTSFVFQVEVK